MWTLENLYLPEQAIANNPTVQGLELLELGSANIRSPLFRTSVLTRSYTGGSGNNSPQPGAEEVIIADPTAPDAESYLYVLDGFVEIEGLTKVNSINKLNEDSYTFLSNKTYLLTNQTSIETKTDFFTEVPNHDLTYQYQLSLTGFGIESISKVEVEGLIVDFNYDDETESLVLLGSKNCKPQPGRLATISTSKEIDLSLVSRNRVFLFSFASLPITFVSYLDHKGEKFYLSSSLRPGTLFNNHTEKLAIAISKWF